MQGQSPYLINTGLFYKNEPLKMDIALLYNRIGKRIIGVGKKRGKLWRRLQCTSAPQLRDASQHHRPLVGTKKFGNHLELKLNIRDLLAEKVYYKQFADVTYSDGRKKEVEEVSKMLQAWANIGLQAIYKF